MQSTSNHMLRQAREARGWRQIDLAEKLQSNRGTIIRWENGTEPSRYYIQKLCELFDTTPGMLGLKDPGRSSGIHDPLMPPPSPSPLVGRDAVYLDLRTMLMEEPATTLVLHGLPGVGKTALARTLIHDALLQTHFQDGILWAGLGPVTNTAQILSRWGMLLGIAMTGISASNQPETWVAILNEAIGTRRMLLVIDDVWDLTDVIALKIGGSNCTYLLTTRFPLIAAQGGSRTKLIPELTNADSTLLLQRIAPQLTLEDSRIMGTLVGGLPLALNLIGKYMHAQAYSGPPRRIRAAIKRLQDTQQRLQLTDPTEQHSSLPAGTTLSLQSVIEVSIKNQRLINDQARQALKFLSIFPPKPNTFSEEAALFVAVCSTDELDALSDAGLLEVDATRYQLHQAISDYAHMELQKVQKREAQERLIEYVTDYVERHSYDVLEQESTTIFLVLEIASGVSLIRIIRAITAWLIIRGFYELAETHLQRILTMYPVPDDMGRETYTHILLLLGQIAQKQGRYSDAMNFFQQSLAYARALKSAEWISAVLADLAWVIWKIGQYRQAEEYLNEGLILTRQINNKERICTYLRLLGSVHSSLGNNVQSMQYSRQGLTLASEIDNKEHICVLLIDLGVGLLELSDFTQAQTYLQEGLIVAQQLGHREWMSLAYGNLSEVAIELQNYTEGIENAQQGLHLARQINHREWIPLNLCNLGICKREMGQHREAEAAFREALERAQPLGRPMITFMSLYEYALCSIAQGQIQVAHGLLNQCLTSIPDGDRQLQCLWLFGMARLLMKQGKTERAIDFAKKSLSIFDGMNNYKTKAIEQWLLAAQMTISHQ